MAPSCFSKLAKRLGLSSAKDGKHHKHEKLAHFENNNNDDHDAVNVSSSSTNNNDNTYKEQEREVNYYNEENLTTSTKNEQQDDREENNDDDLESSADLSPSDRISTIVAAPSIEIHNSEDIEMTMIDDMETQETNPNKTSPSTTTTTATTTAYTKDQHPDNEIKMTREEKERYKRLETQLKSEQLASQYNQFAKHQRVSYYHKANNETFDAFVVGVHFDDGPDNPYYTIKYYKPQKDMNENGEEIETITLVEKQTDSDRLSLVEWNDELTWNILSSNTKK